MGSLSQRWLAAVLAMLICAAAIGGEHVLAAPRLQTPAQPTPETPTADALESDALTLNILANAVYQVEHTESGVVELAGGRFTRAEPPLSVALASNWLAFGDLDGDGAEDAAVILVSHTDSDAILYDLALVLNQAGAAANVATFPLGDRIQVEDLHIDDGRIFLNFIVQGPDDSQCCPTLPLTQIYVLEDDQVIQDQIPSLTLTELGNTTYLLNYLEEGVVELENGEFEAPERIVAVGLTGLYATGDLNGDHIPDAAVVLATQLGDSSIFYDLAAVINLDGEPVNFGAVALGDRVKLNHVSIANGIIYVDMLTQGSNDLLCCPTLPVVWSFGLVDDQLVRLEANELTLEELANARYPLPLAPEGAVQLQDGMLEDAAAELPGILAVRLHDAMITFGDLDGDGANDAVVVLVVNTGGSGIFFYLVPVRNDTGSPTPLSLTLLGDRVQINGIHIANGVVFVDLIVQGPEDPICCPTQRVTWSYTLQGEELLRSEGAGSGGQPILYFDGARFGYVNLTGDYLIEPEFVFALDFAEGLAPVSPDGTLWGYIDEVGNVVIEPQFALASPFAQGSAVVTLAEVEGIERGYIDRRGQLLFDGATFANAAPFSEGLAAVSPDGSLWGYITRTGAELVASRFNNAYTFREGLAAVSINGQWGYVNHSGRFAIAAQFEQAESFHEGLAVVRFGGRYGYINALGNVVIAPQLDGAASFSEGLAAVVVGEETVYVNHLGEGIIGGGITRGGRFSEGLAAVQLEGLYGYVDALGNIVIEPAFSRADPFLGGVAIVETAEQWGLINTVGEWLVQLPAP